MDHLRGGGGRRGEGFVQPGLPARGDDGLGEGGPHDVGEGLQLQEHLRDIRGRARARGLLGLRAVGLAERGDVLVLDPDRVSFDQGREGEVALVVVVGRAVEPEPLVLQCVRQLVDDHVPHGGLRLDAAYGQLLGLRVVEADHARALQLLLGLGQVGPSVHQAERLEHFGLGGEGRRIDVGGGCQPAPEVGVGEEGDFDLLLELEPPVLLDEPLGDGDERLQAGRAGAPGRRRALRRQVSGQRRAGGDQERAGEGQQPHAWKPTRAAPITRRRRRPACSAGR
ncbi:MAG: hypothetical protein E6J29_00995 [Chloroflexi bacterium]|nr:MAG: hypothetical protein E6J29_00995 [Chloroflexota bacterium]